MFIKSIIQNKFYFLFSGFITLVIGFYFSKAHDWATIIVAFFLLVLFLISPFLFKPQ
ncbi:MAG: hypothetical protein HYV39_03625 [Candidatus Levybacteria bacterium]|nr:hypothetical protein [Candidatus Levybacteria bacterium]